MYTHACMNAYAKVRKAGGNARRPGGRCYSSIAAHAYSSSRRSSARCLLIRIRHQGTTWQVGVFPGFLSPGLSRCSSPPPAPCPCPCPCPSKPPHTPKIVPLPQMRAEPWQRLPQASSISSKPSSHPCARFPRAHDPTIPRSHDPTNLRAPELSPVAATAKRQAASAKLVLQPLYYPTPLTYYRYMPVWQPRRGS